MHRLLHWVFYFMANRVLRDWTDSEDIHGLSAEAERLFTRLIMKADDFGRYLGNVKILKSTLFPLHDNISDTNINLWLDECINRNLILKYQVDGKTYLEIKKFDQKGLKVRRSKYPPSSESERFELIMGYVYVIGTSLDKPVKIGFSMNPWARLKEITANHPENIEILISFKAEKRTESLIHLELKDKRIKNEWFQLGDFEIDALKTLASGEIDVDSFFLLLRSNYEPLRITTCPETNRNETEVKVKGTSELFFPDKQTAFEDLRDNDLYVDECHRTLTGKGWLASDKIDVVAVLNYFMSSKADLNKPRDDIRKHFKNWLVREEIKNLQTYAQVFKKSLENGRATG